MTNRKMQMFIKSNGDLFLESPRKILRVPSPKKLEWTREIFLTPYILFDQWWLYFSPAELNDSLMLDLSRA